MDHMSVTTHAVSGVICHPCVMIDLCATFEVPIFTIYFNTKGNVQFIKLGDLGGYGSLEVIGKTVLPPFDRTHTISRSYLIENCVSLIPFWSYSELFI